MPRRGEGGAGELFGIQAVGAALRRIAAARQRAGQRLGGKLVAESAEIGGLIGIGHGGILSRYRTRE